MINEPIADLLTRIRNGYMASLLEVSMPYSTLKEAILKVLEKYEFIDSFEVSGEKVRKEIKVVLAYNELGKPKIAHIQKVSKPSLRKYTKSSEIGYVRGGFGIAIISTSKGIMAEQEARKLKIGGEVIAEVW